MTMWPTTGDVRNAVAITFAAGYGKTLSDAFDIPSLGAALDEYWAAVEAEAAEPDYMAATKDVARGR